MSIGDFTAFLDTWAISESFSDQLAWLMMHLFWQGLVIGGVVAMVNAVLQTRSANSRYRVAVVGMLTLVGCVPLTWFVARNAGEPTVGSVSEATYAGSGNGFEFALMPIAHSDSGMGDLSKEADVVLENRQWSPVRFGSIRLSFVLSIIYFVGLGCMLLRLICSWFGVRRLSGRGVPVSDRTLLDQLNSQCDRIGLRLRPQLRVCKRVSVPIVFGVIKPVILLPAFVVTGMTSEEVDAILLHELTHIRRGDLLVNCLQRIAESVLFFHPVTWYLSRTIAVEREHCCDDEVLSRCSRKDYASALVRLAEVLVPDQQVVSLAMTGARPSQLNRRVRRILGETAPSGFDQRGVLLALICAALISMSVVRAHAQSESSLSVEETAAEVVVEAATPEPLSLPAPSEQSVGDLKRIAVGEELEAGRAIGTVNSKVARKAYEQARDQLLQAKLAKSTNFRCTEASRRTALFSIANSHGISISFDMQVILQPKLEEEISIDVSKGSLHSVLELVFRNTGLTYLMAEGGLVITTEERSKAGVNVILADISSAPKPSPLAQYIDETRHLFGSVPHSIKLANHVQESTLKTAIDSFLEGKGIPQSNVAYSVLGDELLLHCSAETFEALFLFLRQRHWTRMVRFTLPLRRISANAAKLEIDRYFKTIDPDFEVVANERLNHIEISATRVAVFEILVFAKKMDSTGTNKHIAERSSKGQQSRSSPFNLGRQALANKQVQEALDSHTSLELTDASFRQVLNTLQQAYGIHIEFDIQNISLRSALAMVLAGTKLSYVIRNGKLVIVRDAKTLPALDERSLTLGPVFKRRYASVQNLRSIQLAKSANAASVRLAIRAYLDGKDVADGAVSFRVDGDVVVINCTKSHFDQIDAYLAKRQWKHESNLRKFIVYLNQISAKAAKDAIDQVFQSSNEGFTVTARDDGISLEVEAPDDLLFKIEKIAKAIDAKGYQSPGQIVEQIGVEKFMRLIGSNSPRPTEWQFEVQDRIQEGKAVFELHCVQCHGKKGNGKGTTAPFLDPSPRDFTKRKFANVRMDAEHSIPDLQRVILQGVPGTSMPSFKLLSKNQVNALAEYVDYIARGRQVRPEPKSSLRFPFDIEKAMMMDVLEREGRIPVKKNVPIEVDRGMMFDSIDKLRPY